MPPSRIPALHDVALEPVAYGRDVIGTAQCVGLERAARAITRAPLAARAVIDRCVFPERAHS
jgi:hypothetical protein